MNAAIKTLIKENSDGTVSGSLKNRLRILDERFTKLRVRHAVEDMPKERFSTGGSSITGFRAYEFRGLMWQYLIVLGIEDDEDDSILPVEIRNQVARSIYETVSVRERLWKRNITESEVADLESHAIPE
jgi:nitrogen regulatory protein PII-like uncharacterized protein